VAPVIYLAKKAGVKAKILDWLHRLMFFGLIIRLILEGYLELTTSILLNLRDLYWSFSGESFSSLFALLFISFLVTFPQINQYFMSQKRSKMIEKDFKQKYGDLYSDFKPDSKQSLW